MRSEFVPCNSREEAIKSCPWGAKFAKVEGGYRVFESSEDYRIWARQA